MKALIKKQTKKNIKKAFSLIEALVAISILMIGILGAFILVVRTLASAPVVQSRLVAANLAQEGVELVRQIRDTNFIKSRDFREGLENGVWQIDWKKEQLEFCNERDILRFDTVDKMYHYQGAQGEPYFFRRQIKISDGPDQDIIRVNVIMHWCVRKTESQCIAKPTYTLDTEVHLYNYYSNYYDFLEE